jgi:3-hydroxybutyryl-CoA dehydratase
MTNSKISVGNSAEYSKTITENDINQFAQVTGDYNPIHMDESYAQKTQFKTRIAHGLLTAGLISTVIANKLPGPGTIFLKLVLNFIAPVYIGDTISARVEVLNVDEKLHQVTLRTTCKNQDLNNVLDGEAIVKVPSLYWNKI